MATDIHFDFRKGSGAPLDILYGTVSLTPTAIHMEDTSTVLPEGTTVELIDGQATIRNVVPTPLGVTPEWVYKVIVRGINRGGWSWLVGVPEEQGTVGFTELPQYNSTPDGLDGSFNALLWEVNRSRLAAEAAAEAAEVVVQMIAAGQLQGDQGPQGAPGANSIPADEFIAGQVSDKSSGTYTALANGFLTLEAQNRTPKASVGAIVDYGTYLGFPYSALKVFNAGKVGVFSRVFAGNHEQTGNTGASFKPDRENLRAMQKRTGVSVLVNGTGWRVGNPQTEGEITGPQIKDGVVYHDFSDFNDTPIGVDAVGFRKDGSLKLYSSRWGDTAASMLADGVVDTESWGPICLKDGAPVNLTADSRWGMYGVTDPLKKTGRMAYGWDAAGNLTVLVTYGTSTTSGNGILNGDIAPLLLNLGCVNGIIMDGGGSGQILGPEGYIMPSSDTGLERPVPSGLLINADVSGSLTSPWYPAALSSGYKPATSVEPAYRLLPNNRIEYIGGVAKNSGSFGSAVNTVLVPAYKTGNEKLVLAAGPGNSVGKAVMESSGQLNVFASDTQPMSYVRLDNLILSYATS